MRRINLPRWSAAETAIIARGSEAGKTDAEIADDIARVFGHRRTANAVYYRAVKFGISIDWTSRPVHDPVMARAYKQMARDKLTAEPPVDAAKVQDEAFKAAMLKEGRVPSEPSTAAGTDDPRSVHPNSIGSCTSSAGWF